MAEEFGVVMLALDSRHNTWDGIDSPFGPDVQFIDAALRYTFERVAIDPGRIAIGGLSDGGSYSLSLGLVNGDLFTHLVAVAPGFLASTRAAERSAADPYRARHPRQCLQRDGEPGPYRAATQERWLRRDVLRVRRTALGDRGGRTPRAAMARALSRVEPVTARTD